MTLRTSSFDPNFCPVRKVFSFGNRW